MASYFMVIGVTPQACANSLTWYLKTKKGPELRNVYFISSSESGDGPTSRTKRHVNRITEILEENLFYMSLDVLDQMTLHTDDVVWIPQEKLGEGIRVIAESILERTEKDTQVVIDPTAGRKIMSSSSIVAGLILHQKYNRKVLFSYYWLKRFDQISLSKKAYELGLDEAETIIMRVDDIDAEIKKIKEA